MKTRTVSMLAALLLAAVVVPSLPGQLDEAGRRRQTINNLKQIGLAMHNYHDANGRFPGAAIANKDGKPLLSWRVAILPYIEEDTLYKAFKLDEPWDSEHNKKLAARMPKIYALPGVAKDGDTKTHYRVFAGNGALFETNRGVRLADVTDGTSNTIMVVEAAEPVEWTKPDELSYDPAKAPPKLGFFLKDRCHVVFADGAVRPLSKGIKDEVLHKLITRAGGEVIDPAEINK
jgi:type II secretory pathway pseudopilin PulG